MLAADPTEKEDDEADADAPAAAEGAPGGGQGAEGAVPVRASVVMKRRMIRQDEAVVQTLIKKGSLGDVTEIQQVTLLLQNELEQDMDIIYHHAEADRIEVSLPGLLPA